jgi:hypothetical protein
LQFGVFTAIDTSVAVSIEAREEFEGRFMMPSARSIKAAKRKGVNPYAVVNAKMPGASKAKKCRAVKAVTRSVLKKKK